jgi:hypothetical protein
MFQYVLALCTTAARSCNALTCMQRVLTDDIGSVDIEIYSARHAVVLVSNGFAKRFRLWFSHGDHYDCVYTKDQLHKMRICQAIVLELVDKVLNNPASRDRRLPELKNFTFQRWLKQVQGLFG